MNENVQKVMVLNYLKDNGSITSQQAWSEFGITRLSSVIHRLRQSGYVIITKMQTEKNRYGRACSFAKYVLEEKVDEHITCC